MVMGRVKYDPCPKCRERGRDRRGDNLVVYADTSAHCFACGYHVFPKHYVRKVKEEKPNGEEGSLPRDFTRDVPAEAWKWLLQYGLPYSYWRPYCGFTPSESRLVITHGEPITTSVGRYIPGISGERTGGEPRKWRQWGDKRGSAHVLGLSSESSYEGVVLVEDIISAHKVAQVAACLPLFGTGIYPKALSVLKALKRPVTLWLDEDQWGYLPPKINRLQAVLDVPVRFVRTGKDPKDYDLDEIRTILGLRND
jgi:hypothetical protein